ncbi:MAG: aminodeoxychorismate synthase component I [Lentisphaerae bacterium]|nr:aminodeoxychorismate synthase component I [Lentisphaerota bacterium]
MTHHAGDICVYLWPEGPGAGWRCFRAPAEVIAARDAADVLPALRRVERAAAGGLYAAGYVAYEAAPGMDPAFRTHAASEMPLLWFGLFEAPSAGPLPAMRAGAPFETPAWEPSMPREDYAAAIERIKRYLYAGDTYQVNYSFRLRAACRGDPRELFRRWAAARPPGYAAFLDTGRFVVCSASPELFFALDGETVVSRPMKGTAPRGRTCDEDDAAAAALRDSAKNRAENVMIVDMIRNDIGKVAAPGSVRVPALFTVERHPTVWQMTSTVAARTTRPFSEVMRALFPCASVTGAPKVRTMRIIRELETAPRGVYTGAIGCVAPGGRAEFSVAIRTAVVDRAAGRAEYGVGGGIVWDSEAGAEYDECRVKSAVLTEQTPEFELLETMLWDGSAGYFLLDLHLRRLARSAAYFGFACDEARLRGTLERQGRASGAARCRVRLRLAADGGVAVEATPLPAGEMRAPWKVALAPAPVDRADRLLYHKTTFRAVYERARASAADADDVLLWNSAGEITESTIANVVVEKDGRRITPPVGCGLLPGVFREWLLSRGEVREGIVRKEDLRPTDRLFLVNSVRGWIPAQVAR